MKNQAIRISLMLLTLAVLVTLSVCFTRLLEDKDLSMIMSLILGSISGWIAAQVYILLD